MLAACALLAAGLTGLAALAPLGRLHYVAWRYRRQLESRDPWPTLPDPTSSSDLREAADMLASRRASPERVRRMLGPPRYFARTEGGGLIHFYDAQPGWLAMWGSWGSARFSSSGVMMVFADGLLVRWEECELGISDTLWASAPGKGSPWSWTTALHVEDRGGRIAAWTWKQPASWEWWERIDYDRPPWVARVDQGGSGP